ncbi:hypothetical protein B0H66DRAFT_545673 [Apodospora peruviana]|uniref:Uncharacterized protein n=1 Tax=Apodospora peruviana TaxID=516989 RepID=A0AAE0ITX9_9PEZI|nr:hypothetical protein B0H66DRAFT_545673 [Apodospora peruviana]
MVMIASLCVFCFVLDRGCPSKSYLNSHGNELVATVPSIGCDFHQSTYEWGLRLSASPVKRVGNFPFWDEFDKTRYGLCPTQCIRDSIITVTYFTFAHESGAERYFGLVNTTLRALRPAPIEYGHGVST